MVKCMEMVSAIGLQGLESSLKFTKGNINTDSKAVTENSLLVQEIFIKDYGSREKGMEKE